MASIRKCVDYAELKRVREVSEGRYEFWGPLISTPELHQHSLGGLDEVLILASDGLWDVMSSQAAVCHVRRHLLRAGTTPTSCANALVRVLSFAK